MLRGTPFGPNETEGMRMAFVFRLENPDGSPVLIVEDMPA
jgi:hypothetical protein